MLMTTPEHVARHQMPATGGNSEPAQRQWLILGDALAIQQDLPKQRLRFNLALARREQNRLRSAGGTFGEHGAQLSTVEDFLAAQLETHTSTQRRSKL
jgi:hypothetical protein